MKIYFRITVIAFILLFCLNEIKSQSTEKVMIIIIDGARYTETLGDLSETYTPEMWNLARQGTMLSQFKNDNYTFTSRAIPALWSGTWTDVHDTIYQGNSTKYALSPSIFEYYRKQKNMPADECFYVLKYIPSLWLPSFKSDYGPEYWPAFHSVGNTDRDVANEAIQVMDTYHPHFIWVYLADVDHAGHSGNWEEYVNAIRTADSIVGDLWRHLQNDPFYQEATTVFITNDHGRHDNQHGGFQGHGCGCDGCRHIEYIALGPSIKENYISHQERNTPDMAVTASYLLGINPEYSTGEVMHEIFKANSVESSTNEIMLKGNYPNPFVSSTKIHFYLSNSAEVQLTVFDITGREIAIVEEEWKSQGDNFIEWDAKNGQGKTVISGIYFYQIQVEGQVEVGKLLFIGK